MCDLSVGVFERAWHAGMKAGLTEGMEKGMEKGIENANRLFVMHLLQEQMPLSFIMRMTGCTEEFIRQVAEKEGLTVKK